MGNRLPILLLAVSTLWFLGSVAFAVHFIDQYQEMKEGRIDEYPPNGPDPTPAQLREWIRRNVRRQYAGIFSAMAAFSIGLICTIWIAVGCLRRRRDRLRPGFEVIPK